ncbi:hypothetical protein [Kordia sp.]|uniref:hypothetical protein n=1 Tax=Kordia sp. TaxID=1965332 RepID=UPI003D6C05D0
MKKKNLNSLKLNKKSISNFQANGGALPASRVCVPMRSDQGNTCGPISDIFLSMQPGIVCIP